MRNTFDHLRNSHSLYKGLPNENGTAVIIPPFEKKDDCAFFYRGAQSWEIPVMSKDLAKYMYGSVGAY